MNSDIESQHFGFDMDERTTREGGCESTVSSFDEVVNIQHLAFKPFKPFRESSTAVSLISRGAVMRSSSGGKTVEIEDIDIRFRWALG